MQLTKHFSLEELTRSQIASRLGLDNTPSAGTIENLFRLSALLEQVRELLKTPLIITSGYRSAEVNKAVGSKESSQHRYGCAADFIINNVRDLQPIFRQIAHSTIAYDQLIYEFDSWIHISIPNKASEEPRTQSLIINKDGVKKYENSIT